MAARPAPERRPIPALPRIERRVHEAIDLRSGKRDATTVFRPLNSSERVQRLANIGFEMDASLVGTPLYRLTPQAPYQLDPEAWIDAFGGTFNAGPGVNQILWRLPATFETEFMPGCNFTFHGLPAGPSVLSLEFEAFPYQGLTGVVVVDIGAARTEFSISATVAQTVDIGFAPDTADPLTAMVFFRPGLIDFVFHSTKLGRTIMPQGISPWPVVKSGANGHPVKTLQHLLRERGASIAVDGVFGPQTDVAAKAFQTAHGLTPDGIVGPLTWAALIVEVKQGSQGEAVKGVQEEFQFRNLSGDPSKGPQVDGIFGPVTDAAVRGFQHALSLDISAVKVDGIVGPITWQALVSGMLSF